MTAKLDAWLADSPLGASAWRARSLAAAHEPTVPSGWARLDAHLPGGGWPLGTLTELLLPRHGVGELSLLVPALRRLALADTDSARWLTWIGAPHDLHAPALVQAGLPLARLLLVRVAGQRERLWAAEQALGSRSCAAVLVWLDEADDRSLRRLKLAAAEGQGLGILLRPLRVRAQSSPAPLRLLLEPTAEGLAVEILKRRGGGGERLGGVVLSGS